MLDIKLIRSNPDLVKENIKKKFQEEKLPLVDEVLKLDEEFRASKGRGDELRQQRNAISKEIGKLMSQGKKEEAMEVKKKVQAIAGELEEGTPGEINGALNACVSLIQGSDFFACAALAMSVARMAATPR